jgi:class 3 adenylate cyclase/tetratricopeptide (TPR) repeat protein
MAQPRLGLSETSHGALRGPNIRAFLLADLRGYSRYTVEHGDSAAADLAQRFESLGREVVAAHHGSVFGTAGDQVLAVFSSTREALAAALELQTKLMEQKAADPEHAVEAGIGLDAGEAIPVGDDFRGSAVNLAARLCSLAAAGEVLASEALIHLAGKLPDIRYTERGLVQLKGFADPIRVLSVAESASRDGQGDALPERMERDGALPIGGFLGALPSGPMVARQEELERVLRAVDAVAGGGGRLVMLVGEPGVGKTRLAQEMTLNVRNRQFLVAAGRCYEPRQTVAFYPFLEALAALYESCPPAARADVPHRWPYLLRLLPEQNLPVPISSWGQEEQERLFRAVGGFLCAIAAQQPVALLLDDLHWADSASLDLLQHLARQTRSSRVLLLGTYRDVEVQRQHPLSKALRDLQREGLVERVPVRRLDEGDTATLIAATMGEAEISPEFADLVHRSTEGNPFFTQEVLRNLVERGDVYQENGRWERRDVDQIVVPESVRDAIGERLSRLSEETQEVLREASVLGQTFGFAELAGMSPTGERELEAAFDEAIAAGLVQEAGDDSYSFDHALTQGALYEELSARRRRRLHLAAGEALERLSRRKGERMMGELAWHFLQGDDAGRALRYSLQAGDEAAAVSAQQESNHHYQTALELAEEVGDEEQKAQALEKLGATLRVGGEYDEALGYLEQAATMRRQAGEDEAERRIVAGIGWLHALRATPEEGIERVQALLSRTDQQLPSSGLAQLYTALAQLCFVTGRYDQLLTEATRAAEVAAAVGDERVRAVAEGRRGLGLYHIGRYEEALAVSQAAAELAEAVGDLDTLCRTLNNASLILQIRGDFVASRAYLERALEVAERLSDPAQAAFQQAMLANVRFLAGEWEGAQQMSEEAVERVHPLGQVWYAQGPLVVRGMIGVFRGSWEQAVADLDEAIAISERSMDKQYRTLAQARLAERDLLAGDPAAVLSRIEPLLDTPGTPGGVHAGHFFILEADARLLLGQPETVDELADKAVRRAGGAYARIWYMEPLRVKAMARAQEGRWTEAQRMFGEALELARSMPYPYAEANILYHWGGAEAARSDTAAGRAKLEEALAIFRRLGAAKNIELTERALAVLE